MHYNTEWCITKMQNMGKYLSTHISGRATVAVWESGSGAVYCCDMPFTINYQENFMEV